MSYEGINLKSNATIALLTNPNPNLTLTLIFTNVALLFRFQYMKTSRSRSHDGTLELITGDISKCTTLIINQSLHSGIFPDKLKFAKVTPIHKKCDSKLITNLSPIYVFPVLSIIFETVICDQLSNYFESNNLLCPQYRFTKIL